MLCWCGRYSWIAGFKNKGHNKKRVYITSVKCSDSGSNQVHLPQYFTRIGYTVQQGWPFYRQITALLIIACDEKLRTRRLQPGRIWRRHFTLSPLVSETHKKPSILNVAKFGSVRSDGRSVTTHQGQQNEIKIFIINSTLNLTSDDNFLYGQPATI